MENWDRESLKLLNRQKLLSVKHKSAVVKSLISLSDRVYPGVNKLFASSNRIDGKEKWIDYFDRFWHVDLVRRFGFEGFNEEYRDWCEKSGYNYRHEKAQEIYNRSVDQLVDSPPNASMKGIVHLSVDRVKHATEDVRHYTDELVYQAQQMPEYPIVLEMGGVSPLLAARLIAELGDVRRFKSRAAITAYAGVDPGGKQSGAYERKSNQTSKKGSSDLRQTLSVIMDALLENKPEDDPVYQFMDKKRSEGKKYRVYTTAGANKFLRIYLGKVGKYLDAIDQFDETQCSN